MSGTGCSPTTTPSRSRRSASEHRPKRSNPSASNSRSYSFVRQAMTSWDETPTRYRGYRALHPRPGFGQRVDDRTNHPGQRRRHHEMSGDASSRSTFCRVHMAGTGGRSCIGRSSLQRAPACSASSAFSGSSGTATSRASPRVAGFCAGKHVGERHQAGYSVTQELPILRVVFIVPAALAALVTWPLTKG